MWLGFGGCGIVEKAPREFLEDSVNFVLTAF
jgi:hypothetical protein